MADLDDLVRDLDRLPDLIPAELQRPLTNAVEMIRKDAQGRASWSSRIPGSIVMATQGGAQPGVYLGLDPGRAAHAPVYEGASGADAFTHPVYGNRNAWVTQRTRPFLLPAVDDGAGDVEQAGVETVDVVLRRLNFR